MAFIKCRGSVLQATTAPSPSSAAPIPRYHQTPQQPPEENHAWGGPTAAGLLVPPTRAPQPAAAAATTTAAAIPRRPRGGEHGLPPPPAMPPPHQRLPREANGRGVPTAPSRLPPPALSSPQGCRSLLQSLLTGRWGPQPHTQLPLSFPTHTLRFLGCFAVFFSVRFTGAPKACGVLGGKGQCCSLGASRPPPGRSRRVALPLHAAKFIFDSRWCFQLCGLR